MANDFEHSMIEKMQLLPLLQGLSLQEFDNIIINLKLDFRQYEAGDTIVSQGERCNALIYIIEGDFEAEYRDDHCGLVITEQCSQKPYILEPNNLFGVKRNYERSYSFVTKGATFQISRDVFLRRLLANDIVRLNYVNYLCNNLRKANDNKPFNRELTKAEKVLRVLESNSLFMEGSKQVRITMYDLASLVDETRLNVSAILNDWNSRKLISLRRYGCSIDDFAKLRANANQK